MSPIPLKKRKKQRVGSTDSVNTYEANGDDDDLESPINHSYIGNHSTPLRKGPGSNLLERPANIMRPVCISFFCFSNILLNLANSDC